MRRRAFVLAGSAAAALGAPARAKTSGEPALKPFRTRIAQAKLNRIEADSGGRLGVCVLDTATGHRLVHRADERFPMCSTFKLLAAAMVLQRVDGGQERLDRPIAIERAAILPHSPVTEPNAAPR
jgi:beta-lactamase class A